MADGLTIKAPSARGVCFWMVMVALGVRLAVMAFVYPAQLNPARDHWKFGGESGRIARSVAQGAGYSSPYFAHTGPTAWLAPVFPLLLAGVFKVFGVYTKASALAILSLNSLLSALTCIPVFLIARRTFDHRAALWAGWIWAFFPYAINFATSFVWDTTLSTLLVALLFLVMLKLEDAPLWTNWLGFGALAGFAALSDPVILSVAPFFALWLLYVYRQRGQRWFAPGAAALLGVVLVMSPWFVRNGRTFHKFIPVRSGFWFELYCGNNADSWHWDPPGYHPSDSETEWREYQHLGETGYMALKKKEALAFIGAHKKLYALQTLRRIIYFWTGFWSFSRRYLRQEPADPPNIVFSVALTILALGGLWRAWKAGGGARAMPYIIAFVVFPLVYYVTHPEDYYRRPLDPLAAALVAGALVWWRPRREARARSTPGARTPDASLDRGRSAPTAARGSLRSGVELRTAAVLLSVLPFLARWALRRFDSLRMPWFASAIGCTLAAILVVSLSMARNCPPVSPVHCGRGQLATGDRT